MTQGTYLEMTYRHGKPIAGYLYLPRKADDRASRSRKVAPGLVVDYAPDGRAIGIEFTSPSAISLESVNRVFADLHLKALSNEDLAPLLTA